jgi:tetratricopeptide (TPR) repeat protein
MRFAVASIWAFFLIGLSLGDLSGKYRELPRLSVRGKRYKIFAAAAFLLLCGLWARKTVSPLISRKKLASEIDFFDSRREYSKEELKRLVSAGTEDAQLYYKLGWTQAKDKEFSGAVKNFKKAIELDETLTGAYNNLGNIYYTMGKRNEAAKYYRMALERDPGMADAHFNLGYIYYYQGRLKEATREFNEVLRLQPDNYKAKLMLDKMVQ